MVGELGVHESLTLTALGSEDLSFLVSFWDPLQTDGLPRWVYVIHYLTC